MTGPGLNSTYGYNGLDTRVSKNAQTFLRDGAYVTDPVLRDGQANYTPGISERRSGTTTFQHSGLKNVDAQSSVAQTLTATRQFDVYGNVAASTGAWQGPFGYGGGYGYQSDSDTGLMLLGHRYLDPSTGRFLTRDPVRDGRNWYGYVKNNPVLWADPQGLSPGYWLRRAGKAFYKVFADTDEMLDELIEVGRRGGDDRIDFGHRGGPVHGHDGKVHLTDAASADRAPGPEWENWRDHSGWFPSGGMLLISIITLDPIGSGEELGNTVDPYVRDAARGYRFMRIDRWLGE